MLIPVEGKPFLLIGPEGYTYAADRSKIADIRLLKAFRESSEPEYPGKKLNPTTEGRISVRQKEAVIEAVAYLKENYHSHITLEELAMHIFLSKDY